MAPTRVQAVGKAFVVEPNDQDDAFWALFVDGGWEASTLDALSTLAPAATLYVDVGAWVGPTVLVAAAAGARKIVAYEPDPAALDRLMQNLDLNPVLRPCITMRAVALARRDGQATLSSAVLGDSMATLVRPGKETATVVTVDAEAELRRIGVDPGTLIKVDVEGSEFNLLGRLQALFREQRPTLIVSWHYYHVLGQRHLFHAQLVNLREKRKVIRTLLLYPYWYLASETSWHEMTFREKVLFLFRMRPEVIMFAREPVQLAAIRLNERE